ncbi:hypothetical protein [Thalassiella azotivora]
MSDRGLPRRARWRRAAVVPLVALALPLTAAAGCDDEVGSDREQEEREPGDSTGEEEDD